MGVIQYVDDLPNLAACSGTLSLRTRGRSALIRSSRFITQILLESSRVAWLDERSPFKISETARCHPRRIRISGSDLWSSETSETVAELLPTEDGGVLISARHAETGRRLWERYLPVPEAADWAEKSPAWPGAQTEDINAFFAEDPTRLIVCMSRQSRRTRMYSAELTVDTLPPHAQQTDAIRLDLITGVPVWQHSFHNIAVGIIERQRFTGIWSRERHAGIIDFDAGINRILLESPHQLGWPVHDGFLVAVPWHCKGHVGVTWLDRLTGKERTSTWGQPRARATLLHPTESGLAIQVDDQRLWWLGKEDLPLWSIRAKPYIYRVFCSPSTDVFVGTDGRGGRLLAHDPASGRETLNVKPPLGGAGTLTKVPAHEVLVAKFWTSRTDGVSGNLLVLSMRDRRHHLNGSCLSLLGTWTHGAICVTATAHERLAIVDVR